MLRLEKLLKDMESKLFFMLDLTQESMKNAISYYFEHQGSSYKSVMNLENTINEYENAIDEHAIRIFALEHPVANDLRKVVMSIKMDTDLERIGDLAYNIASRAHSTIEYGFYGADPALTRHPLLVENYEIFQEMLTLIKESLMHQDLSRLKEIISMDERIDDNNSALFRELLQACVEEPHLTNFYLNQITISKNLERAGDHCTNLAQDLVYIISGVNIRHREWNYDPDDAENTKQNNKTHGVRFQSRQTKESNEQ